jgi:hypothetical protein
MAWLLSSVASAATVRDGRLDLSQEKLGPKSKLELNGPWRFYPKVFLEAEDFAQEWPSDRPFVMVQVPGRLAGEPGPDGLPMPDHICDCVEIQLIRFF